jgi:hypothetical protein
LVGYIDARKSREPGEFTTEHKAVVRATAGLLGLVVDRLTLQKSQLSLTDRLIKDDRFPAMMYAVWRLANQSKNLEELLLSLVPAVTRAIPSVATVLRLWDHNHVMLRDAETGPGKEVLTLRRILDAEHPATLIRRSVWARRFGGDDWRRDPDGKNDFNNRFAVIMIPLHCTGSLRGVFTLARQGEDAEFTTEEKQALCVVSGLVSSYGQNREVDAA